MLEEIILDQENKENENEFDISIPLIFVIKFVLQCIFTYTALNNANC